MVKQWVTRVIMYTVGLFFMAVAVAFSVNSDLGVSPVNSLPYSISTVTGFTLGNCVTAVFCFYILVQVLILRKDFKLINLLQIVFSTIFGYFADFAKWLCAPLVPTTYPGRLLLMAVSIVLIAFGIMLYLQAQIVSMPMEGMTMAVHTKLSQRFPKLTFPTVKIIMDCCSVGLAVLVVVIGTGSLTGVREGTVLAALLVGKVLAVFNKYLVPGLRRVCGLPAKA